LKIISQAFDSLTSVIRQFETSETDRPRLHSSVSEREYNLSSELEG